MLEELLYLGVQAFQLFLLEKDRVDPLHNFFPAVVELRQRVFILTLKLLKGAVNAVLAICFCLAYREDGLVLIQQKRWLLQRALLVQRRQRLFGGDELPVIWPRKVFHFWTLRWVRQPACQNAFT